MNINLKEISSLSVLDFVYDTKDMNEKDFIVHAETLKLRLKQLPVAKGQELHCMQLEIEHLIDFIKQVCWRLEQGTEPALLKARDVENYKEIITRYYPDNI